MRPHLFEPFALTERFWSKVEKSLRCWNWTAHRERGGYGLFKLPNGRNVLAHRAVFASTVRPIPPDMLVLHRCDNPRCVNPEHLFLGTSQDNFDDMVAKGRHRGCRSTQTHCKRGHPLTPGNVFTLGDGMHRQCKACTSIRRARSGS